MPTLTKWGCEGDFDNYCVITWRSQGYLERISEPFLGQIMKDSLCSRFHIPTKPTIDQLYFKLQLCSINGSVILYKYPWVVCQRWWDGGIFWWWYPGQQLLCSYDEPDSRATANGRLGFTKVKKKLTCLFDENIFCKTNNKVKRATGPKYEVRSPTLLPVQILSFVKPKVSCWSAASKCLCSTFYLLGRVVFIKILSHVLRTQKLSVLVLIYVESGWPPD